MIDFHSHILPGIDDGATDLQQSDNMIKALIAQGVEHIIATPHYIRHTCGLNEYLDMREKAYNGLLELDSAKQCKISLGSEVYIERDLASQEGIEALAISGTNKILMEFPYSSFEKWAINEIYNLCYSHKLVPILAHVERYLGYYSSSDVDEILEMDDAIFQVNAISLCEKSRLKFILELIEGGYPVVLGSDAHNMISRIGDFKKGIEVLKSKLSKRDFEAFIDFNKNVLEK
ncbi:MAG: capsular polysaccharide biosynthesis protein [Oscillospiraceae bacterium]|nr:capsular polysaccharide biosynthesis protein [Oscillospiraceae bacterium]